MKRWLLLVLTIVFLLTSCRNQQVQDIQAQELQRDYFIATGHTLQGKFLHFFNIYGGVESLGYPLTEEITVDGWTMQYFEKGRLELHPENEPAYRITVGWLGDLLHRRRPPIPISAIPRPDDRGRLYFPQTGHTLSGDFLNYFTNSGGTIRFGLPISEPFLWEGQLVQDFQSARFYWTPTQPVPVTLEEIGRVHFDVSKLDRKLLQVVPAPEKK